MFGVNVLALELVVAVGTGALCTTIKYCGSRF